MSSERIQVNPNETIALVYQLNDPNDFATTFYIRATIRNSISGATLTTKDLTVVSNGRYTSSYQVPNFNELQFDITTDIYEDSGYTSRSLKYSVETARYIADQRWNIGLGGARAGIGRETVKEVVTEALGALLGAMPSSETKIKYVNYGEFVKGFEALRSSIEALPKPERVDFSPVLTELRKVSGQIGQLPKFEPTDLSPVISAIHALDLSRLEDRTGEVLKAIKDFFITDMKDLRGMFEKIQKAIATPAVLQLEMKRPGVDEVPTDTQTPANRDALPRKYKTQQP